MAELTPKQMMSVNAASAGVNAASDIIGTLVNQAFAEHNRKRDYYYAEKSANAADARQRAQYYDMYSPKAQLEQIKDAGLSPSMMMNGGGGSAGGQASSNLAVGGTGIGAPYLSPMDYAQMANINAQTQLFMKQADDVEQSKALKEIEVNIQTMQRDLFKNEYELIQHKFYRSNGESVSLAQMADESNDYNDFLNKVKENVTSGFNYDYISTEKGQETLRSIYYASNKFTTDINILSQQNTDALFQLDITNALKKIDYANMNAQSILQDLQNNISVKELETAQKDAWNNMLKRLEKTNPTLHDIAIILWMIADSFLQRSSFNNSKSTSNSVVTKK